MRTTEEHIVAAVSLLRYLILNIDIFFPHGCNEEQTVAKYATKLIQMSLSSSLLAGKPSVTADNPETDKVGGSNAKCIQKDITSTDRAIELVAEITTQLEIIRKYCGEVNEFDAAYKQLIKLKAVTQDMENLKPFAGVIATVINQAATIGQADQHNLDKITRLRTAVQIFTKECRIVVEGIKNNLGKLSDASLGHVVELLAKINFSLVER